MRARDELRDRLDARVTDAELDAVIVNATPDELRAAIKPEMELHRIDMDHLVWDILDAAWDSLQPRVAVIVTDRTVLDGDMFDPGALSRFIVEHAADDLRAEVWLIVDRHGEHDPGALIAFAQRVGIRVTEIALWRSARPSHYTDAIVGLVRRSVPRIVVADPQYRSHDPRITIHRRVTR